MKNTCNIYFFYLILIYTPFSFALQIIHDQEIEDALKKLSIPLIEKSHLSEVKILLIKDNNINAFTAGGHEIAINTGLFDEKLTPEMIAGIIAHEIGHVDGYHVVRKVQELDKYQPINLSIVAFGMLSAFLASSPELAIVGMSAGSDWIRNSSLKNSRVLEFSADQYACRALISSHYNPQGLIDLFYYFKKNQLQDSVNAYKMTHPLDEERLEIAQHCIKKFHDESIQPKDLSFFKRIIVKVKAFTSERPEQLLEKYKKDFTLNGLYAQSILYYRLKNFKKALYLSDKLLAVEPDNSYFNEWKGQILFQSNRANEALNYYDKALKLNPKGVIVQLEKIMLELENDVSLNSSSILERLNHIISNDNNNFLVYRLMLSYYEKTKDEAGKLYALSRIYLMQRNIKRAELLANNALKKAGVNSILFYQIKDLIVELNSLKLSN